MHTLFDIEKTRESVSNRYEAIVVASRYAHFLANARRNEQFAPDEKPIFRAMEIVASGEARYTLEHKPGKR